MRTTVEADHAIRWVLSSGDPQSGVGKGYLVVGGAACFGGKFTGAICRPNGAQRLFTDFVTYFTWRQGKELIEVADFFPRTVNPASDGNAFAILTSLCVFLCLK